MKSSASKALAAMAVFVLAGCSVGPDYVRPAAPTPKQFKELSGWKQASPSDGRERGSWWAIYRDPRLAGLLQKVNVSNQTVAAALAAYDQSRALVRESQSGLLPNASGGYSVTRAGVGSALASASKPAAATVFYPQLSASWEPDVWGKIRRQVEGSEAGAQASAADVANAKLSAQAQLAVDYFKLRTADSLKALLAKTIAEYTKTLEITENQFSAGTVSKADVITAKTQLLATQAQEIAVETQRQQYEHAIAVLAGELPETLSLPPLPLAKRIPAVPVQVPSTLLERRPDIAAAERAMQQANAGIGVAVAAYYPDINLSALIGATGSFALPLLAAHEVWSIGASASAPLFDGGLRNAQVDAARSNYNQTIANYRQTVLSAFQDVEDQLVALRVQTRELAIQEQSAKDAEEAVGVYLSQFRAGTVAFTTVVVAEATALSQEEAALATRQNLFVASVMLVEALGGGWDVSLLPGDDVLTEQTPLQAIARSSPPIAAALN